jgi:hypothetical protein
MLTYASTVLIRTKEVMVPTNEMRLGNKNVRFVDILIDFRRESKDFLTNCKYGTLSTANKEENYPFLQHRK